MIKKCKVVTSVLLSLMVCSLSLPSRAYMIEFLLAPEPTPIIDGASAPPLGFISFLQTSIQMYTETEEKLQDMLKNLNTSVDLGIVNVNVGLSKDSKKIAKGLLDVPDDLSREYTGVSSKKLAQMTQNALTTTAGTIESIEQYRIERKHDEQKRAIELVASSLMIKNGLKDLQGIMKSFEKSYKGGAKDYNKALRDNANVRILYDQLLSLHQQIVAQRIQIKGGEEKTKVIPLNRVLGQK